jgi:membrane protein required for colicin V production
MTWVDWCVLGVIALSALLAFTRGLVHEALGIGAWVGAVFLALGLRQQALPLVADKVDTPWLAEAIAAGGIFLAVLLVLKLVVGSVARLVQDSALGGPDRALGLLFGAARGAFFVVVAYILGAMAARDMERWPDAVLSARALPFAQAGSAWLIERLPEDWRPRLSAPAASPGPNREDLLRPPARNRT